MSDLPITAREARARANEHRARALRRREEVRKQLAARQEAAHKSHSIHQAPLDRLVDEALKSDRFWAAAVSDNQWWLTQAAAFGAVETTELLQTITQQNAQIIAILKEIRDDRRASSSDGRTTLFNPAGPNTGA